MKVIYCLNNLTENSTCGQFSYLSIWQLLNVLSQTDPLYVICDKKYLFWTVNQIMKIDHTWMFKSFKTSNFSLTSFFLHRVLQLRFVVYFHCILTLVSFIKTKSDLSISSGSNNLAKLVVF